MTARFRRSFRDLILVVGVLAISLAVSVEVPAQEHQRNGNPALAAGGSFAPMLEKVIPAVVTLRVRGERPVPLEIKPRTRAIGVAASLEKKTEPFRAGGSGVIVDAKRGYILTNNHVIEYATDIQVGLSTGQRLQARLVGTDVGSDVAVIKIEAEDLPSLTVGDSDLVRVGDIVAAIGNPFGLEGTATLGIVSALMRTAVGHGAFEDYLQTDAQINPGNSGGALVDMRGELIGINTVAGGGPGQNVGIGFAIPVNMAMTIMEELITAGRMRRGSTGLVVEDLPDAVAEKLGGTVRGAIVSDVMEGSSAAKAGVKIGDIVVSAMNKPVRSAAEFVTRTVTVPLGTSIPMILFTEGQGRSIALVSQDTVVEPAEVAVDDQGGSLGGMTVGDVLLGNPSFGELRGAQILKLADNSPAHTAGFETGDIIVGIDEAKVRSAEELLWRLSRAGSEFRVILNRDGQPAFLRARK